MAGKKSDAHASAKVAGIDVGGPRKGFHIAVLEESGEEPRLIQVCKLETTATPKTVVEFLRQHSPLCIAVDSPRQPAPPNHKSRTCEKRLNAVIRCGIRYTPDHASLSATPEARRYYAWIQNGLDLYQALGKAYWGKEIECFPTASWARLGGLRNASRAEWTRRILEDVLQRRYRLLGVPERHNQDVRDAIVAAYTALLHLNGKSDTSFSPIIVPRA
jgi:predicted nuclease with RNAse H fold